MTLSGLELAELRRKLIEWGRANFREFPWRNTRDPYKILISEVMLHRTRAEQVVPVYDKFLRKYPDVHKLASADISEVEEVLAPLGLRWRIQKLHQTARIITEKYAGRVPDEKDLLLKLPGISEYIASAVMCFAYGKPEPLLDTNTVRILGRMFDVDVRDSSRRSRKFQELMRLLIDRRNPREFNYALLDLAATLCIKRGRPRCSECPLGDYCKYRLKNI